MARRFAIYAAPREDSALWQIGNRWLGRDPVTDTALDPPVLAGFSAQRTAEITEAPRRYGFHATLKPPFRLAPGISDEDLITALSAFAEARTPISLSPLTLTALDGFLALACTTASPMLDRVAADCVREFDAFRAAMDDAERARRQVVGLTPRQKRNVRDWGYPYVMKDFRFHMTLTSRLAPDERARVFRALGDIFGVVECDWISLESICLFEQKRAECPFILRERFDFD